MYIYICIYIYIYENGRRARQVVHSECCLMYSKTHEKHPRNTWFQVFLHSLAAALQNINNCVTVPVCSSRQYITQATTCWSPKIGGGALNSIVFFIDF